MKFDTVIVGAGPAGISAAIYAKRYNLNFCIIEKEALPGGKVLYPHWIENFIGIPEGISGIDLSEKLHQHAKTFDIQIITGQIDQIKKNDSIFEIFLANGEELQSSTIILANGTKERSLNIPGEQKYKGRGVSWCATCDAPFFRNKTLAVIGGGDSALAETLYLTEFASKIHLIHRRTEYRGAEHLTRQLFNHEAIIPHLGFNAVSINGNEDKLSSITIESLDGQTKKELDVDGIFIFAGYEPDTAFLSWIPQLDEKGYIIGDDHMKSSIDGLFAAGDIRSKPFRQIITAMADGAIAAHSVRDFIRLKG
jgi:thioredoxin reductase (NADPH)